MASKQEPQTPEVTLKLEVTKEDISKQLVNNHFIDLKRKLAALKRDAILPRFKAWEEQIQAFHKKEDELLLGYLEQVKPLFQSHTKEGYQLNLKVVYLTNYEKAQHIIYTDKRDRYSPPFLRHEADVVEVYNDKISKTDPFCSFRVCTSLVPGLSQLIREMEEFVTNCWAFQKTKEYKEYLRLAQLVDQYFSSNSHYWKQYTAKVEGEIVSKLAKEVLKTQLKGVTGFDIQPPSLDVIVDSEVDAILATEL